MLSIDRRYIIHSVYLNRWAITLNTSCSSYFTRTYHTTEGNSRHKVLRLYALVSIIISAQHMCGSMMCVRDSTSVIRDWVMGVMPIHSQYYIIMCHVHD